MRKTTLETMKSTTIPLDKIIIHPMAEVQTKNIGKNTTIWQFAIVLKNAKIGENCNINSHTFIENDVVIGDNVTVKCGVYLWDGLRVNDNVFIGPNATFTNDKFPRSKEYPEVFSKIIIRKGASIGGGAIIMPDIEVGKYALVGAGAVVTKNVPDYAVVVGNPARVIGTVPSHERKKDHMHIRKK